MKVFNNSSADIIGWSQRITIKAGEIEEIAEIDLMPLLKTYPFVEVLDVSPDVNSTEVEEAEEVMTEEVKKPKRERKNKKLK